MPESEAAWSAANEYFNKRNVDALDMLKAVETAKWTIELVDGSAEAIDAESARESLSGFILRESEDVALRRELVFSEGGAGIYVECDFFDKYDPIFKKNCALEDPLKDIVTLTAGVVFRAEKQGESGLHRSILQVDWNGGALKQYSFIPQNIAEAREVDKLHNF